MIEDSKTSVKISKTDVANGEELEGAKIQIKDSTGKVVEEWTSGKEAHEVTGLKTGVTYTLHEEVAPDGYTIATDTTFSIDETGKVTSTGTVTEGGVLLIEDSKTSVDISKVTKSDGKKLSGAKLQLLDPDGNVVDEWTSTNEVHKVIGLKTGVTYTIREEKAPNGYEKADTIKFTIGRNGSIKVLTGGKINDGVILVENAKVSGGDEEHHEEEVPIIKEYKIHVHGAKGWNDQNNIDNLRPQSITLHLMADGVEIAAKTVTASTNWVFDFGNLPMYKAGNKIRYTLVEDAVENYQAALSVTTGENDINFTLVNTHEHQEKTKAGSGDADGAGRGLLGAERGLLGAGRTGDGSHMVLYGAIFAAAVAAIITWFVIGRRREEEEDYWLDT